MAAISEQLKTDLREEQFCEGYTESFLDSYVATQIKVLREQREMTQKELADVLGTTQTAISRIESINYSAWNIGTLKRLARAFKVRLRVSFETCGSLIDDYERFTRDNLQRVSRDNDPVLYGLTSSLSTAALALGTQNTSTVVATGLSHQESELPRMFIAPPKQLDLPMSAAERISKKLLRFTAKPSPKAMNPPPFSYMENLTEVVNVRREA